MKKNILSITAVLVTLSVFSLPSSALAQLPGIRRTELQRQDLSTSGHEAIQVRIDFDPGAVVGKHIHPGEEIIYVLEGTLKYDVAGKPPVTLEKGDVLFIPTGTIHSARNVGIGNAAELATYTVEKGEPLVTFVNR
jgi:quercetin dioxygenase-like cupin family protein